MPETIKKEDGTEVTVYSAEELKAQQDAAVAAAVAPLQADLVKAKEDLAKATDKDFNFATLRQKVEDLTKAMGTAEADALAKFEANSRQKMANDAIANLAEGDAEMKKKIEFHFARLSKDVKTDEDMKKAVADAFTLARGSEIGPDGTVRAFGSGDGAPLRPAKVDQSKPPLTDGQMAFLKVAYPGITDEQIKELDAKAKPPKVGTLDGNFPKVTV